MSLQNLPEDWLYSLLPDGVVQEDVRGLLQAVVGGYQDHLEDVRAYVQKFEVFVDPVEAPPEEGFNSILALVVGDQGNTIPRSLLIDETTPADQTQELNDWVVDKLGIDESRLISAQYAVDSFRVVDSNILEHLAATIGAVIYKTSVVTASLDEQRRIVSSYFPRLKIKGTAKSFETLGRLAGFDDTKTTPLWGRVSPRLPNDVGNPVNAPDFSAQAHYQPSAEISATYDPGKTDDGDFYQWSTGTLSTNPEDPNYYESAITGFNPWVKAIATTGTVFHPKAGAYLLAGGGPHVKAEVSPSGSGLKFQALAEGESFNDLQILVTATGSNLSDRTISITDRLSSIKYRTSYFDLAMFKDITVAEEDQVTTIQKNKDLEGNPTLAQAGTAVAPFYPWTAGTVQADVNTPQLDTDALTSLGVQTSPYMDEVRAATRFVRRVSVGYISSDAAIYAAFQSRTDLFPITGAGTYAGTTTEFPAAPYLVNISVEALRETTATRRSTLIDELTATLDDPPERLSILIYQGVTLVGKDDGHGHILAVGALGVVAGGTVDYTSRKVRISTETGDLSLTVQYLTLQPLSAEFDDLNSNVINFSGTSITGYYDKTTGGFVFVEGGGITTGYLVSAVWSPTSTEIIRVEPSGTIKQLDRAGYQERPEDQENFIFSTGTGTAYFQDYDEYAWRRPIVAGGEVVNLNYYQPPVEDLKTESYNQTLTVYDHRGAEFNVVGIDDFKATPDETIRVLYTEVDQTASTYRPSQPAVGRSLSYLVDEDGNFVVDELGNYIVDSDAVYNVGLVQGVLVADPQAFIHTSHRDGLVAWLPFNEHPEDDLVTQDHSRFASTQSYVDLQPSDRQWDILKGWFLRVRSGVKITSTQDRELGTQASLSFFFRPISSSSDVDATFLSFGPVSFDVNAVLDTVNAYVTNTEGARIFVGSLPVLGDFTNFLYCRASGDVLIFGVNGSEVTVPVGTYQDFSGATLTVTSKDRVYDIHDLRIWGVLKSTADLLRVSAYPFQATAVSYSPSYFFTAGRGLKYGYQVLDNGFVYPASFDDVVAQPLRRVTRYAETGRYTGDPRFKEVGLGGGQIFPGAWKLGNQFYPLLGLGRAVVSTKHSALPGINSVWDAEHGPITVDITSLLVSDTLVTVDASGGTASVIPSPQQAMNPTREVIWVEGKTGSIYAVTIDDDGTGPRLVASETLREREPLEWATAGSLQFQDEPTGAEVQVTDHGTLMTVENDAGTLRVVMSHVIFNFERPPVYLYNQTQVVSAQSGTTNWDNRNTFGLLKGIPALDAPGVLSFLNTGTLLPGPHRLNVDAQLLGIAGADFPGFDLEVTVGGNVFPMTLLADATGQDPRETDVVEFDVESTVVGKWPVEFNWMNDLDNAQQGIFRDLAIHGYEVRRINPRLYHIVNSGTLELIDVTNVPDIYATPPGTLPPGGWLGQISNSGTITQWTHESSDSTRSSDDTFTSKVPISDTLTTVTDARREDLLLLSYTGSLAVVDPPLPPAPVATVSSVVHDPLLTTWLWAGATTTRSVKINARLSGDGLVQAVLSRTSGFATKIYSDFVMSSSAANDRVVSLTVKDLEPDTVYFYAVGSPASPDFTKVGQFKTFPEGAASFTFAVSCCAFSDTSASGSWNTSFSNSEVFDTIRSHGPLFFLHMGDMHYSDINANVPATYRQAYDNVMVASRQAELYRSLSLVYMWDDNDYDSDNADTTAPGKPAAQSTYRLCVPHYQLTSSIGSIYHAFACGRVYFIITDLRSEKDAFGTTMLGAAQKAWFKQQLLDANGKYPLIVWMSSVPWIGPNSGGGFCDDGWCQYVDERQEIADFIVNNNIQGLVILSGDMHAVAADDGTDSDYASAGGAGIPVLQAAPLDQSASIKGGPYTLGPIPSSGAATVNQFALVTVTDSGDGPIEVSFSARDADDAELLSFSFTSDDSPKP